MLKTHEKSLQYILFKLKEQGLIVKGFVLDLEEKTINADMELQDTEIFNWIELFAKAEFKESTEITRIESLYKQIYYSEKNIVELKKIRRQFDSEVVLDEYLDLVQQLIFTIERLMSKYKRK